MKYHIFYGSAIRRISDFPISTTVARLHSEAWRRIRHLIVDCPIRDPMLSNVGGLGFGTGWRSPAQQSAGGTNHAALWRSWHQGRAPDDDVDAVAVDLVDWSTGSARGDGPAIRWANDNAHRYGLVHGREWQRVSEPWHHQVVEVSVSRPYLHPTPHTLPRIALPGDPAPPTPPPSPPEDDTMRIYLAYTLDATGQRVLWRGNGLDSNRFDAATQYGMEGRPIDSSRNGPYWHPLTETKLTHWSQVPTLTAQQVILDLGKPR